MHVSLVAEFAQQNYCELFYIVSWVQGGVAHRRLVSLSVGSTYDCQIYRPDHR